MIHIEAFNAGAPRRTTSCATSRSIVADAVPGSEVTFAEGAGTDPRSYKVDFSKIARRCRRSVARGIAPRGAEQLAAAYRAAVDG